QPVLLLLFGSVGQNVMRRDAVDSVAKVHSGVAKFFGDHGFIGVVASSSAVFFGNIGAQYADVARLGPRIGIDAMLLTPAGFMRNEFFLDESLDVFAKKLGVFIDPRGDVGMRDGLRLGHEFHCTWAG